MLGVRHPFQAGGARIGPISWTQLAAGKFCLQRDVLDTGPMRIAKRSLTVACRGEGRVGPETAFFGIVDEDGGHTRWNGYGVDTNDLAATSDSIDVCTGGPGSFFTIALDAAACDLRFEQPAVLRHANAVERLRSSLRRLFGSPLGRTPALREAAAGEILETLLATLRARARQRLPSQTQNRRLKAVRLCQEYMVEHLERTVTLVDLARVSGLGVRSLFNAFEAVTGLSPMAYLRAQRLSRVHDLLLHASPKETRIIDIAADWGFWHMGHFAGAYAAMFGETPSQTLMTVKNSGTGSP